MFQKEINHLVSGGSSVYDISFLIPPMVGVGLHTYTLYYTGSQNDTYILGSGNLYVHDIHEKIYQNLRQQTQSQFMSSDYQSSTAKGYLSQAEAYFSQAESLASQGKFVNSTSDLNSAQSLLNKADSAEQSWVSKSPIFKKQFK